MASNADRICTIANSDLLDESEIRKKITCGELVLVDNTSRTVSSMWSKLRVIADSNNTQKVLEGWAACRFCETVFRTHSKLKPDGTRKNYGLTSPARHLDVCKNHQRERSKQAEHSTVDGVQQHDSLSTTKRICRFFFNKKNLPSKTLSKLKEAEIKYVVAGKVMSDFLVVMAAVCFS
jgi:hypothetical protein